jgi:hypothetical protein
MSTIGTCRRKHRGITENGQEERDDDAGTLHRNFSRVPEESKIHRTAIAVNRFDSLSEPAYNVNGLLGIITETEKRGIRMIGKKKIGDVLKEAGLIDDFQIDSALAHQRNWGGRLGAILVELGYVREGELAKALADRLHLPYVNLLDPELSEEITALIKAEIARKYQVVPVRKEGKSLVLAMADPLDLEAMDAIRFITGATIKPAVATGAEIDVAIKKYYEHEDVTLQPQEPASSNKSLPDTLELIPGSDLNMRPDSDTAAASRASAEEAARQLPGDATARLDALIGLLIEEGLVSSEKLAKRIQKRIFEQKKGL